MLNKRIIAKNSFYLSYSHKKEDVDYYLKTIEIIFKEILELIKKGNIKSELIGSVVHDGFYRLS